MRKVPTLPGQASPKALGMNSKNPMPQARPAPAVARKAVAPKAAGMARGNVNLGRQQDVAAKKAAEAKAKAAAGLTPGQMRRAANVGPAADAATAARRANATQTPTPMPGMAKGGMVTKANCGASMKPTQKGKKK